VQGVYSQFNTLFTQAVDKVREIDFSAQQFITNTQQNIALSLPTYFRKHGNKEGK